MGFVMWNTSFAKIEPRKKQYEWESQRPFRRETKSTPEYPRESARGCEPSRTRRPRGCRGAERPTLAPSETKAFKRTACIVGNQNLHQNSSGRAREGRNPLAPRPRGGVGEQSAPRPHRRKPKSSKNSLHHRKPQSPPDQPRESARGCEPSLPRPRGGVGEQSAPRPHRRK